MKYKELLKKFIPPILLGLVQSNSGNKRTYKPQFYCPVCEKEVLAFDRLSDYYLEEMDKHGLIHSIFCAETLNILHYSCPHCGSSDRNRLYNIFLKEQLVIKNRQNSVIRFLDVAPDPTLSKWIKTIKNIEYRSVDLYMEGVDDIADITDLNIYTDASFNVVLCSHVLEHITDDRKAMSELYRILKKGGFAILMVPIFLSLEEDFESDDIKTPEERWKYYGQDDHVRAYSKKGFVKKLEATGFSVDQFGADYFSKELFEKCGIHSRSVLYIANK